MKKSARTLSREDAPSFAPGHGGMRCACCTMGRPVDHRKMLNRAARRKTRLAVRKEAKMVEPDED